MTTHNFHRSYGHNHVEHKMYQISSFSQNTLLQNERKRSLVKIPSIFPLFLCEQQEEERWKEADTYTASTQYWLRDVTYHNLDTYQN